MLFILRPRCSGAEDEAWLWLWLSTQSQPVCAAPCCVWAGLSHLPSRPLLSPRPPVPLPDTHGCRPQSDCLPGPLLWCATEPDSPTPRPPAPAPAPGPTPGFAPSLPHFPWEDGGLASTESQHCSTSQHCTQLHYTTVHITRYNLLHSATLTIVATPTITRRGDSTNKDH